MFAASGSPLPSSALPVAAPVPVRAEPAAGRGVSSQTAQAVKQASPIRFNPHLTYANDIDRVLVQVRDAEGKVTVQYPSEQAVREYRRQMEAGGTDEAAAKPAAPPTTDGTAPGTARGQEAPAAGQAPTSSQASPSGQVSAAAQGPVEISV
ncbi:hypothetical protein [Zavarzinia compransoris]|uniref:Uncharacterized protein n=1 Tax=Zavarzinia compransoris TaxID=1264899 RepID=A0A317E0Q5_9PROT|nr:hypothetical protein [Zavarzinia compransoris]PWR19706.1 hypothetical protein DKG75_14660 [Zavarzinia compransoris]TDP43348.1 hypothetical protein DES42_11249 [Zavarzinia compransoris]